jgi:hypothetical protein
VNRLLDWSSVDGLFQALHAQIRHQHADSPAVAFNVRCGANSAAAVALTNLFLSLFKVHFSIICSLCGGVRVLLFHFGMLLFVFCLRAACLLGCPRRSLACCQHPPSNTPALTKVFEDKLSDDIRWLLSASEPALIDAGGVVLQQLVFFHPEFARPYLPRFLVRALPLS